MSFRLGGIFLVISFVAIISAQLEPNFSLYSTISSDISSRCYLFTSFVKLFPLNYPKQEKIFFELRTPCNRTQYPVSRTQELRASPNFDINKRTVVFISGWNTYMNDIFTEQVTKAYLCRGDVNFIVVNPSDHLRTEYINSAYNTGKIGEFIALGLKNLNISGSNIHLIGHSLGSHTMGSAGRNFALTTLDKISRITGLDPARPCFIKTPDFPRLSTSDATFVDIIHSNPKESGSEEVIGHADFYPGGLRSAKPGCLLADIFCSHMKSIEYYAETVYVGNENNFIATRCDSYAQLEARTCSGINNSMGYAANASAPGIYILDVNNVKPYGKNATSSAYLQLNQCGVCAN